MSIETRIAKIREENIKKFGQPVPNSYQGVSKEKIKLVLTKLDLGENIDLTDAVFALLDDQSDSFFTKAADKGMKVSHGASTAHIACHVGILQRGRSKLDREGRDYWIKPLRQLGGIETITLVDGEFVEGHIKAKSSNSSYRLNSELVKILKAPENEWLPMLEFWNRQDTERSRLAFQARAAEAARNRTESGHSALIKSSIETYSTHFLEEYQVIYVDDGDGDRITIEQKEILERAGVTITLEDGMPDVLLWNQRDDSLWVIEAVTSDGEVDPHKVTQLSRLAKRCGKSGVGFTTTYRTWKDAAGRQQKNKNIAIDTYIWIEEDPSRQLMVESSKTSSKIKY